MSKKRLWGLAAGLLGVALLIGGCTSNKEASSSPSPSPAPSSAEPSQAPAAQNVNLVVRGDTVNGTGGCVLQSRFTVGEKIVFRAEAIDPITNEHVKDAVMKVHLSTGDVLEMKYGAHPRDSDVYFWTAAYTVTEETPTGTLEYYVTAEHGPRKGEFHPFNVAPSLLTIVPPETAGGEAPKAEAPASAPAAPANVQTTNTVNIIATNFKFNQDKWYVKAGEEVTVTLKNEEGIHGIRIEGLNVEISDDNGSVKFKPEIPGEYKIVCSIFCGAGHEDMVATLVVV